MEELALVGGLETYSFLFSYADCLQTQESTISDRNLLVLCILPELYTTYTNTAHPNQPLEPGIVLINFGANNAAALATVKASLRTENNCLQNTINIIGKKMTEQVNSVTRAHNVNSQVTSEDMVALRAEGVRQAQELA